jgi:type I restriction enzyme R subunit
MWVANDTSKRLYDRNRRVPPAALRREGAARGGRANTVTVWLVNWADPLANDFAVAEEVTVPGRDLDSGAKASTKRPDVVLYVNGIALGVLELKRSTVSVSEGIRQNLDNQKKEFIQPFFSTMQWVMAGNDTEGLRYATIETPEKYWPALEGGDRRVRRRAQPAGPAPAAVVREARFLELIHDFIVFDAGIKKAVPAEPVLRRGGGAGVHPPARGRHHLAHPGQRQVADDGVAGQVDPREPARTRGC